MGGFFAMVFLLSLARDGYSRDPTDTWVVSGIVGELWDT